MTARIVIADDHALLRSGLRMLLDREPDFSVAGEASSGTEALERSRELKPEVLILDVTMPGVTSLEVAKRLKAEQPGLRIVILTMHEEEEYLRTFLEIGADAYVVKRAVDSDLCEAIRAVLRGETYVHPALSGKLVGSFLGRSGSRGASRLDLLTEREQEVCRLIAQGNTNREVAEALFISVRTVETHRANLMRKLDLSTRAELVRFASTHGLLNPEISS